MLERQVDDPVGRRRGGAQLVEIVEGPAQRLGAARGEGGGRGVGAGEPDDLVTRADELGDDGGADPTGGAGDQYAHEDLQVAWPASSHDVRAGRRMTFGVVTLARTTPDVITYPLTP